MSIIKYILFSAFILSIMDTGKIYSQTDIARITKEFERTIEKRLNVNIEFGVGTITISRSKDGKLFKAEIDYSEEIGEPEIGYDIFNETGLLKISMKKSRIRPKKRRIWFSDTGFSKFKDVQWDLSFNDEIPISFDIEIGAARGDLDFTGLNIEDLNISTGASKIVMRFDEPNKSIIKYMKIETGLGKFKAKRLLNANFQRLNLESGLGACTLDLTGNLNHKARVDISVGIGSVTIFISRKIGTKIIASKSLLSSISIEDLEQKEDGVYYSDNYGQTKGELVITIEAGIGNVDVEVLD